MRSVSRLVVATVCSVIAVACSYPVTESAEATSSEISKNPIDSEPDTVPILPHVCKTARVEAHRPSRTCAQIQTHAGGSWQIEYLFPNVADARVHDHFCAYTWVPSAASCQDAPLESL